MYVLLNTAASDFANSTSVDHIGYVPSADPMSCFVGEVVFVEGFAVPAADVADQQALANAVG